MCQLINASDFDINQIARLRVRLRFFKKYCLDHSYHFFSPSAMSYPTYYNYSPVFPNPLLCLQDFVTYGATEFNTRLPWNGLGVWMAETAHWIRITFCLDWAIVLVPLLFFVGITAARVVLNKLLIHVSRERQFFFFFCDPLLS